MEQKERINAGGTKPKKKNRVYTREEELRLALQTCVKDKDLLKAISLYEQASSEGLKLNIYLYNALLYLCASAAAETSDELAIRKGFEIYQNLINSDIPPNEATFTAVARIAAATDNGEMAFDLAKKMVSLNLNPRLRSYSPALMAFCRKKEAEKAYEVDEYMLSKEIKPEEEELEALLRVSVDAERQDKVYSLLHRLRVSVRQVSESTSGVIEQWFRSRSGSEAGQDDWDEEKVREALVSKGGGWHGMGWLGSGAWKVHRTKVSSNGVCECCQEQLACIDIEDSETENFAKGLEALACSRGSASDFKKFQEWLDHNGPYEFVVDGANVGLYQQNFSDGGFSFSQLNSIINALKERSSSKRWPLIIMHTRRTRGGRADDPENKELIQTWKNSGALYSTPFGSNDDWYWLYAAVRCRCLLVTNDEMRDHLFELLGTEFFPKWKERHLVRYTFNKSDSQLSSPQLLMPPSYSIVIQESVRGSWHIPVRGGYDSDNSRSWLCVTRTVSAPRQKINVPPSDRESMLNSSKQTQECDIPHPSENMQLKLSEKNQECDIAPSSKNMQLNLREQKQECYLSPSLENMLDLSGTDNGLVFQSTMDTVTPSSKNMLDVCGIHNGLDFQSSMNTVKTSSKKMLDLSGTNKGPDFQSNMDTVKPSFEHEQCNENASCLDYNEKSHHLVSGTKKRKSSTTADCHTMKMRGE